MSQEHWKWPPYQLEWVQAAHAFVSTLILTTGEVILSAAGNERNLVLILRDND